MQGDDDTITEVAAGSVASGKVRVGDRLIKINGLALKGLNHPSLVQELTTKLYVTLVLHRESSPVAVTVSRPRPNGSFGFMLGTLNGGTPSAGRARHAITEVTAGSVADGLLCTGDAVLEIDGRPASELDHKGLVAALARKPSVVTLTVSRAGVEPCAAGLATYSFRLAKSTPRGGFGFQVAGTEGRAATITDVVAGSVADGVLRRGDTLLEVNGQPVASRSRDTLITELTTSASITVMIHRRSPPSLTKVHGASGLALGGTAAARTATSPPNEAVGGPAFEVGDRVIVKHSGNGTVRFAGPHHDSKRHVLGIELDLAGGMHDGTVMGRTYFRCKASCGIVVAPRLVTLGALEHEHDEPAILIECPVAVNGEGMGIVVAGPVPGAAPTGCFIHSVVKGSPADRTPEIRPGMLIQSIGGKSCCRKDQFQVAVIARAYENMNLGGTVALQLQFAPTRFKQHDGGALLQEREFEQTHAATATAAAMVAAATAAATAAVLAASSSTGGTNINIVGRGLTTLQRDDHASAVPTRRSVTLLGDAAGEESTVDDAPSFDEPTELTISLDGNFNGNGSLGLMVVGPEDFAPRTGCYVHGVAPMLPAHRNGHLRSGQLIHEINGNDCIGLTKSELLDTIRRSISSGQSAIRITVEDHQEGFKRYTMARNTPTRPFRTDFFTVAAPLAQMHPAPASPPGLLAAVESSDSEPEPEPEPVAAAQERVIVTKRPGTKYFGFLLGTANDGATIVTQVAPGSGADGVVAVGDQIVELDGQPTRGVLLTELVATLARKPATVSLGLHRA